MNDTGSSTSTQSGQTLVLITVFMLSLLGMCALAIDVGTWYQQKRAVQSAADASALAGADNLPSGWAAATTAAGSEFTKNISGATASYQQTSVFVHNDSITVTASKPAASYFAKALTYKAATLSQLGRLEEELAVYDQMVARFGSATDALLREQAARALVNKGITLSQLGRPQAAARSVLLSGLKTSWSI